MRELTGQRQSTAGRDRFPAGGLEFFALLARLLRRPRRGDLWGGRRVHPGGLRQGVTGKA